MLYSGRDSKLSEHGTSPRVAMNLVNAGAMAGGMWSGGSAGHGLGETTRPILGSESCAESWPHPGALRSKEIMEEDIFEVTPVATLAATTALFLELTALLHKRGAISAGELGRNLLAASTEAGAEENARCV